MNAIVEEGHAGTEYRHLPSTTRQTQAASGDDLPVSGFFCASSLLIASRGFLQLAQQRPLRPSPAYFPFPI